MLPGRKRCAECTEHNREYMAARQARFRADGKCIYCGSEIEDAGYRSCRRCREYYSGFMGLWRETRREQRAEREAAGKCVTCGVRWAEPGMKQCRSCMDRHNRQRNPDKDKQKTRERQEARRAAGLCIQCGAPAEAGKARCKKCLQMQRERYKKWAIQKRIRDRAAQEKSRLLSEGKTR